MSAVSISLIIFDLLYNIAITYFYYKIGQVKINAKSWKDVVPSILILVISALFTSFLVLNVTSDLRFWLKFIMEVMTYAIIFRQSITRNLMITLLLFLSCAIAEVIIVVGQTIFFQIPMDTGSSTVGNVIEVNSLILIMYVLFLSIPAIQKLYQRIIHWYSNKDFMTVLIITIIGIYCSLVLLGENFNGVDNFSVFIANNVFSFGVIALVIILIVQKANNNRIIDAYDKLMDYIKIYEKVITDRGKQQHEYKNQLILIRSMLKPEDKKTIQYINEQLKIETADKKMKLFGQLKNVPEGGLKGLIYYKVQEMEKNNVNIFVSVDSQLEDEKMWKICDENLRDISRIIGVYLDNAAEAAKTAQQKSFTIDISSDEGNLIFSFSNTYSGSLDPSSMENDGYTTKGLNRGFGLSLVRDILAKNKYLSQSREVNGRFYVQRLIIHNQNKNEY